jgi:signal transduction histidine kinase
MTGIRDNNTDFIHAAQNVVQWCDDVLNNAPLTVAQRDDLQHVRRAARLFYEQAQTRYSHVLQSGDDEAIQALRHRLRNHLNIVVGFTQVLLREMPDNLLLHLLTIRKIHQTGQTLLMHVNRME